jgi:general stress protein 26
MSTHEKQARLDEVLKDFDIAILTTHAKDGTMHARPMALAQVEGNGGEVWFCAGLDSPKIDEISRDPNVMVSVQGKTKFAAVRGRARVVQDRAKIHELWKPDWKLWFPEGKDDPNLCLVALTPIEGEYWDNSGKRGVRFAIEAAKALVKGTTPKTQSPEQHAKVRM